MKVKADEFDGKVVYGEKKKEGGAGYAGHRSELAPTLATLTSLETQVCLQLLFYYFILLDSEQAWTSILNPLLIFSMF